MIYPEVQKFIDAVRPKLNLFDETADDKIKDDIHQAIEVAYEKHISDAMLSKDSFLSMVHQEDSEVFTWTVNHLFAPINWSRVTMHKLWGVKNTTTGNLVSLGVSKQDDGTFVLRDGGSEMSFSPMTSGNQQHIVEFLKLLQQNPRGENMPVASSNEVLVAIDFEGVNPMNLEVVEIKVIF